MTALTSDPGQSCAEERPGSEPTIATGLVTIGYLSGHDVANDFAQSLANIRAADALAGMNRLQHPHWFVNQRAGVNVAIPRNQLVYRWLALRDPAPEWLLMVDADMIWQPGALESLLAAAGQLQAEGVDHPIVGGLCPAFSHDPTDPARHRVIVTCYKQGDIYPGHAFAPFAQMEPDEIPPSTLVEVYGTGAAFLLVHREVFLTIAIKFGRLYPWFRDVVVEDQRVGIPLNERNDYPLGEDLFFCLQAQRAGHRIFVHTGVEVQHVKTIRLTERLWRTNPVLDLA